MKATRKPTMATVKREAANLGATVENDDVERCGGEPQQVYQCIAPRGKVWACDGSIHMLLVRWTVGDLEDKDHAIADAIDRMTYGLVDCEEPDCDFCSESHS